VSEIAYKSFFIDCIFGLLMNIVQYYLKLRSKKIFFKFVEIALFI